MLRLDNNPKNISKKEYNILKPMKDWNRLVNPINKKCREQAERAMVSALKSWRDAMRARIRVSVRDLANDLFKKNDLYEEENC